MNALGWILSVAAVVGMALVLIPDRRPVPTLMALRASRARQAVRETRPVTILAPAGAVTVGAAVAVQWGAALGVTALVAYGLCAWGLSVRSRSALRTTRTEGMARLTTVLANQASTASTVGVALERAAPLVRGSVGAAAQELARGYQRGALADAAREFVTAVPVTAAVWLTDILAVAGRGGAKVSDVLTALEALAASEADAARHFHRRVAAQMVPLVVSLVLSAGTVGGMGLWMPSYGSWLLSPAGQLLVLGGAVATAAGVRPGVRGGVGGAESMIWVSVAALAGLAVVLVIAEPAKYHDAEDLAAAGWSQSSVTLLSWGIATVVGFAAFAGTAIFIDTRSSPAVGLAAAAWVPMMLPPRLRRTILASHNRRQSSALHSWLRRVRLYTASGLPMRDAAVEAAHQTTERAFTPVASAIAVALEGGRDPLTAAATRVRGSAAETLLGTVDTVDRSGAAGADLIDHVVNRAIAVYAGEGAERTDRLGRALGALGSIVVAFGVMILMLGIAVSINSGGCDSGREGGGVMDSPIAKAIGIVLVVAAMAVVGVLMWTQLTAAQEDIEDINPYKGITNQTVCEAAGGTWTVATKTCA